MSGQMTAQKEKNRIITLGSTNVLILAIQDWNGWKKSADNLYYFRFGFLINGLTIYDQGKGKTRIFFHLYSL